MLRRLFSLPAGPPDVRLHGPRCLLRPPRSDDWGQWAELRSESRAFLQPWEPTWPADALTRAAYDARLRRAGQEWRDDSAYSFFIFDPAGQMLVGGLSFSNVRRGVAQAAMMGYWVGRPFARRGYVAAAARLALAFAFGPLKLHRVEAACLPGNAASRGLLTKLGFVEEGVARGYLRIDGAWRDHMLYALLDADCRG